MENENKNRYQTKLDKAIEQSEQHTRMLKNKVPNALGKFADSHCNSDWKLSKNGRVKVNWIGASKDAPSALSSRDASLLAAANFLSYHCQKFAYHFDPNDSSKVISVTLIINGQTIVIK